MKKIILIYFCSISLVTIAQKPLVSFGTIKHFKNFKSEFIDSRNVDVWLPEGYSNKNRYAVLYINDGQNLFDSSVAGDKLAWGVDETVTKLIQNKEITNCIIVAIWNNGKMRHAEYFPQKPFEVFSKTVQDSLYGVGFGKTPMLQGTVQSDAYLKFLVKELKPFIDRKFHTIKNQQNTFIAGSSMGGLISIYAICEYPDVFGGAACLSTYWPGLLPAKSNLITNSFIAYLQNHLPAGNNHKLYFDYGTIGIDYLVKPLQQMVDSLILQKGYSASNFSSLEFKGANHNAKFWKERFDKPVLFLLKN